MERRTFSSLRLAAALALVLAPIASGCAPNKAVVTREPPASAVRLPLFEGADFRMRSQALGPVAEHGLPLSEADEIRGRWLTIFEADLPAPEDTRPAPGKATGRW